MPTSRRVPAGKDGVGQQNTVAEITSAVRGLAAEVPIPELAAGLGDGSVVNCDGLHTVRRSSLSDLSGEMDDRTMRAVCRAVTYALGC